MKQLRMIGVLLCMLVAGCVTQSLQAPKLTVLNVGMISADVFSQQFHIRLHVQNPNNVELSIKSIEYQLFLQGDIFADGTSQQAFVVPAHGEVEFDTVINTDFMSSIVRLLGKLNDSDGNKVQYTFIGKVHLGKGLVRNLAFSSQGVVDLNIKK